MEFSQAVEYNMRSIFLSTSCRKKLVSGFPLFRKSSFYLTISLILELEIQYWHTIYTELGGDTVSFQLIGTLFQIVVTKLIYRIVREIYSIIHQNLSLESLVFDLLTFLDGVRGERTENRFLSSILT